MGADKEIIVALEFGTSAIRGIAGRKKTDGTIQVLGIEQERTSDAVQRGIIYNIDKTTQAITNVLSRLNEHLGVRINRAYVGIGGQSLHTVGNFISREFQAKVKITPELIDNLKDNNRATQYTASQILEVVPQEYVIGPRSVVDPIGIQTDQIESHFLNIVAKNVLLENIQRCMRMANIEIADIFISPVALADVLLSDSEKRSGCAMVDFGAGTTTVAVYSANLLRHLAVIPLGGNSITNDIAADQQMDFEEAETLKRKYGVAFVAAESDNPLMISISNDRTLSENELQYIIGSREEEIIRNVWNQIDQFNEKLLSGIIITGAAAQIKDMPEAIKHFTKSQKVKTAKSLITSVEVAPSVPSTLTGIDTLLALLMHGEVNCTAEEEAKTEEEEEVQPVVEETVETPTTPETTDESEPDNKPKGPNRWNRFTKVWNSLFTEEPDDQ